MLKFASSSEPVTRHLKLLVFGGPGTGKTHQALHAPGPVLVMDTESSTDAYRGRPGIPDFLIAKTASPKDVLDVLAHLNAGKKINKIIPETVVIDSFTVLWQVRKEAGQKKADRNTKAPEGGRISFYEWGWIKRPIQQLYTQLVNMPAHVVLTAREKAVYEEVQNGGKTELKIVDFKPDVEKDAEYIFDLVLRLFIEDGTFKAQVYKTRFPDFYPGQILDDLNWDMLSGLAMVGGEAGIIPDADAAAESESKEPATWTVDPARRADAADWLSELGLSSADANVALDCEDWTQTHLQPDQFAATINAYLDRMIDDHMADEHDPAVEADA